jgi:hypothetical protein
MKIMKLLFLKLKMTVCILYLSTRHILKAYFQNTFQFGTVTSHFVEDQFVEIQIVASSMSKPRLSKCKYVKLMKFDKWLDVDIFSYSYLLWQYFSLNAII